MSRTAADLLIGRAVSISYQDFAADIETEAADRRYRNMPLTVRKVRQFAAIARRAAVADRDDPEPAEAPCSVCGGIRVCLAVR